MNNYTKTWPYLLLVALTGITIALVFTFSNNNSGDCQSLWQSFISKEFEGVIVEKKLLENNHNAQAIMLEGDESYTIIEAMYQEGMYDKVRVGDYILKLRNELKCLLITDLDTLVFEIIEPDCDKFKE